MLCYDVEGLNKERAENAELNSCCGELLLNMIGPSYSPVNKEKSSKGTLVYPLGNEDKPTLYAGEVELATSAPLDLKMASILYNSLQTIPELRITIIRGTISRGAIITIALDKPVPLIEILSSKLPELDIIPESPGDDRLAINNSNLPGILKRENIKRIILVPQKH